jgi:uncharacterized protein (TIGR03437 family)
MRYAPALIFLSLCAAQSLSPSIAIGKLAVDSGGNIYVAQGATITRLNQWTVTVPFNVLGLKVAGNVVVAGSGALASLDPGSGKILSSSSFTIQNTPQFMTVTPAGNIVLSGVVNSVPATPGALDIAGGQAFLMKLDPTGKVLWLANGIGGAVTADAAENIYVAGNGSEGKFPTTADAFQTSAPFNICETTGGLLSFGYPCAQQYVAKVSPDGTKMLFATYLSGALGALAQDIALGPDGSIYTVGSVQATDYPVTSGALIAADPSKFVDTLCNCLVPIVNYTASGFLSRLSTDGSQLLYSTYLGGSQADNATAIAVGNDGSMVVGGNALSPDFPGVPFTLDNCKPGTSLLAAKQRGFLMQISPDGSKITSAQLIGGTNPGAGIACVTDAADGLFADTVSPGQLITINGVGVGPAVSEAPGIGNPALQIGGVSVTFDGIPAPLTAAGGSIVTLGVPLAVVGKQQTVLTLLQNGMPFDSRQLNVTAETPALFVLPANGKACNAPPPVNFGVFTGGSPTPSPMILNSDGTVNACDNPAPEGSAVTFFVNGTGIGIPQLLVNSGELSVFAETPIGPLTSVSALSILIPKGSSNPLYVYYVSQGNTAVPDYRIGYGIPVYVK